MKTMTSLMLAGFATLSLGVGVATAQSLAPGSAEGTYFSGQRQTTPVSANRGAMAGQNQPQYGSSDHARNGGTVPFDTNSVGGGF